MGRGFKAVDGIPAQSTFQQSESRDATGLFQLSLFGGRGGVRLRLAGGLRQGLPASIFMAFQDAMSWQGHTVATLPALSHVAQTWAPGWGSFV